MEQAQQMEERGDWGSAAHNHRGRGGIADEVNFQDTTRNVSRADGADTADGGLRQEAGEGRVVWNAKLGAVCASVWHGTFFRVQQRFSLLIGTCSSFPRRKHSGPCKQFLSAVQSDC